MNNAMIADIEQISPRLLDPMEWTWVELDGDVESLEPCILLTGITEQEKFDYGKVYKKIHLPFDSMAVYVNEGSGLKVVLLVETHQEHIDVQVYHRWERKLGLHMRKITQLPFYTRWNLVGSLKVVEQGVGSAGLKWSWLSKHGHLISASLDNAARKYGENEIIPKFKNTAAYVRASWATVAEGLLHGLSDDELTIFYEATDESSRDATAQFVWGFIRLTMNALASLTMANKAASLKMYLPAKAVGKDKINKARKKKNLQPMLRWTERVFEPQVVRVGGESRKGGTHASPNYHKRRGHYRHRLWEDMTKIPVGWQISDDRPGHIERWIDAVEVNIKFKYTGKAVFHDYKIKEAV